jgi:NAD-dependent dihydropyrimidine dehydrogenase PreA subunit
MVKGTSSKILTALGIFVGVFFAIASLKEHYIIDAAKCNNCGECAEACPEEAISPGVVDGKEVHIIDVEKCTACGTCADVCPEEAISPNSPETSLKKKEKTKAEPEEGKKKKESKKATKNKVK